MQKHRRLSLITADAAQAAALATLDYAAVDRNASRERMVCLSKAMWAHQTAERIRLGKTVFPSPRTNTAEKPSSRAPTARGPKEISTPKSAFFDSSHPYQMHTETADNPIEVSGEIMPDAIALGTRDQYTMVIGNTALSEVAVDQEGLYQEEKTTETTKGSEHNHEHIGYAATFRDGQHDQNATCTSDVGATRSTGIHHHSKMETPKRDTGTPNMNWQRANPP
ncbi:MAG: hypothetical protein AAGL18_13455 [Pseudomonadota bacterium]